MTASYCLWLQVGILGCHCHRIAVKEIVGDAALYLMPLIVFPFSFPFCLLFLFFSFCTLYKVSVCLILTLSKVLCAILAHACIHSTYVYWLLPLCSLICLQVEGRSRLTIANLLKPFSTQAVILMNYLRYKLYLKYLIGNS